MADATQPLTVAEQRKLVSSMFGVPKWYLSWEVFVEAFRKARDKNYDQKETETAHKVFVNDPNSPVPQLVIEFCQAHPQAPPQKK
jgi:hypothetical protein